MGPDVLLKTLEPLLQAGIIGAIGLAVRQLQRISEDLKAFKEAVAKELSSINIGRASTDQKVLDLERRVSKVEDRLDP